MPKSGTADIPHVTVHDHYIHKPSGTQKQMDLGNPVGLYAVNNQNPKPAMQLQAYLTWFEKFDANPVYLKNAQSLLSKGNTEQEIHYHYAHGQWDEIMALSAKLNTASISAYERPRLAREWRASVPQSSKSRPVTSGASSTMLLWKLPSPTVKAEPEPAKTSRIDLNVPLMV